MAFEPPLGIPWRQFRDGHFVICGLRVCAAMSKHRNLCAVIAIGPRGPSRLVPTAASIVDRGVVGRGRWRASGRCHQRSWQSFEPDVPQWVLKQFSQNRSERDIAVLLGHQGLPLGPQGP